MVLVGFNGEMQQNSINQGVSKGHIILELVFQVLIAFLLVSLDGASPLQFLAVAEINMVILEIREMGQLQWQKGAETIRVLVMLMVTRTKKGAPIKKRLDRGRRRMK